MAARFVRRGIALSALAACLANASAAAGGETSDEAGQRVSFRVESVRQVANDELRAVVGVTEEDADPAAAARRVNLAMAWAMERVKTEPGVNARSGGYQTRPVYEEGRIRRWRASQDLVLEGREFDRLTALVGTLQARLQLRSFAFSVSDERRAAVEEELVKEALAAFRKRAQLVRESLDASGYAIDRIEIDTGRGIAPVRYAMEMRQADAPAPASEPGTSRLSVGVQATIALE